jgi:rhamnosyltransferase
MPDFLGLVVLYRPDDQVAERVLTYLEEVSLLLVIDNSETASPVLNKLSQMSPRITVIENGSNLGIARALNQGRAYGLANGFKWLLTMDQDSYFEQGAMRRMKEYLQSVPDLPGILSPFHHTPGGNLPTKDKATKNLRITMTSGNLLNLAASSHCGEFEEKLFIDSVDHEYCLRLRRNGYLITRINDAILEHNLGEVTFHRLLFMKLKTTNHKAARRYYMTRNRLFVINRYLMFDPHFAWRELTELAKAFWAVGLFEDQKREKTFAMMRGAWHFVTGRYGKL